MGLRIHALRKGNPFSAQSDECHLSRPPGFFGVHRIVLRPVLRGRSAMVHEHAGEARPGCSGIENLQSSRRSRLGTRREKIISAEERNPSVSRKIASPSFHRAGRTGSLARHLPLSAPVAVKLNEFSAISLERRIGRLYMIMDRIAIHGLVREDLISAISSILHQRLSAEIVPVALAASTTPLSTPPRCGSTCLRA